MSTLINPGLEGSKLLSGEFIGAQRHRRFVQTCGQAVQPAVFGLSRNNGRPTRATAQRAFESALVKPGTLHRRAVTAPAVFLQNGLDVFAEGHRCLSIRWRQTSLEGDGGKTDENCQNNSLDQLDLLFVLAKYGPLV